MKSHPRWRWQSHKVAEHLLYHGLQELQFLIVARDILQILDVFTKNIVKVLIICLVCQVSDDSI